MAARSVGGMTGLPEVSVVLAVRDGAGEAVASAESVLKQRGVNLELILVDDGSTDPTREFLAGFAAREERVRLLRQPPEGLTAALARGCAEARAPLVARQDAGDFSHPARLARQAAILEGHPEVVLVSCWTVCVGPAGEPLLVERSGGPPGRALKLEPASGEEPQAGPSSHGSVLFRREAYLAAGGYRLEFALGQDWDLWFRLGLGGGFWMVGEPLYLRRLTPRSLSFAAHDLQTLFKTCAREAAQARAAGAGEEAALARARALSRRFGRERTLRLERAEALGCYHLGSLLRALGDPRARDYFAAALRRRPGFARAWVRWLQSLFASGRRSEPLGFEAPEATELLANLGELVGRAAESAA